MERSDSWLLDTIADTLQDPYPTDRTDIIEALLAVAGDCGSTWVSSDGNDNETDLTETMGKSGWFKDDE
jgi:hypothetical protein